MMKAEKMPFNSESLYRNISLSVLYGILAWIVYGIVEVWFLILLPWIIRPSYAYIPLHRGFTALTLVLYPVIGLISGAFLGMVFHGAVKYLGFQCKINAKNFLYILATILLSSALALSLIAEMYWPPQHSFAPLCMYLITMVAIFLSVNSDVWYDRLKFITNPWTVSLLLLGLPWLTCELSYYPSTDGNYFLKAIFALSYAVLILIVSFVIQKVVNRKRIQKTGAGLQLSLGRQLAVLSLFVIVVFVISLFLKQKPHVSGFNLNVSTKTAQDLNVILITMDTVRADHLSLYDYDRDTTPYLNSFSKKAIVFTHSVAPADTTLPSHASIFTGLYASEHGAHYDCPQYPAGRPLDARFNTLAELLSEKGYATIGIVANTGFLGEGWGLNQGFQYYDHRAPIVFLGEMPMNYCLRQTFRNILTRLSTPWQFNRLTRKAEDINAKAFSVIDKVKLSRKPFFLFINYMDAHWPYIPPHPFDLHYPGKDSSFTLKRYFELEKAVLKDKQKVTPKEKQHMLSQYDGAIRYIDSQLKELFKYLKKIDCFENSLIIITADHGEAFGDRELMGHGVSVYQDQVYVPLIIKLPHSNKGSVVNETVSLVDLFPTVLDILKYKTHQKLLRKSLLIAKNGNSKHVISESFPRGNILNWNKRFHRIERAIFIENLKLISATNGRNEFYDLNLDPDETTNLWESKDYRFKQAEESLVQWLNKVNISQDKVEGSSIEALKSLGYLK